MKDQLLILIKQKGGCDRPVCIQCHSCVIKDIYNICSASRFASRFELRLTAEVFKLALKLYVENFGKDTDLLEVLI